MSIAYSFTGAYTFAAQEHINAALAELKEVLEDEDEIPDPFDEGEILIEDTEVRFAIDGSSPSHWFDFYETIVETFAEHAQGGEVKVRCDGQEEVYKASPAVAAPN